MRHAFAKRQLVNVALAANAVRPAPSTPAAVPAFFAGWLTSELPQHMLALTALDTAQHVARRGLRSRGTGLALLAAGTYAALIARGHRAKGEVESALQAALGADYQQTLERVPTPAELATPWRSLVNPFDMAHVDVVAKRRLPYAPGGRRFELDVFHHRDMPAGAPVLLQVHGGGWIIGEKEQQGIPLMMRMAARGWVCVAINYPLSPKAKWPDHLVAVKRAIAWIREHGADYGADPSFIAITGGSAGGHLCSMAALTPDDKTLQPGFEEVDTAVQACVPHYGVYDFTAEDGTAASKVKVESLLKRYVMAPDARYPEDYRAASPLSRVSQNAPPFFVLHGSNDSLVPVREARAFVKELREVSDEPVVYAEISGAQHAFDIFTSVRSAHVVRGVERFLDWTYSRAVLSREADRGDAPLPA
jgi:acetyl esterase/lipase